MTDSVVVFCMRGVGPLHMLLPMIEALSARGRAVHVFTDAEYRPLVEQAGGRFVDLFAGRPIDAADATSIPIPCRFVSFAGFYAESLADEVAALAPGLVLYDTFSVVAPVVARRLGVPHVNVCPNHAPVPARVLASLRADPRVAVSAECREAVRRLREVHGMRDANPFSYVEALSPHLNLYCEPREFLDAEDRAAFEPIAFVGSLSPALRAGTRPPVFPCERRGRRIYVAFGTVIWWYFAARARKVLQAIALGCEDLDVDVVMALGGHPLDKTEVAELERPNVRVIAVADQWTALAEADVFVTHHGLNSTHEAIFHRVPMLSHPFFGDQPALARRCQELGLALPLVGDPGGAIEASDVRAALARVESERAALAARLAVAREWELRTIAERDLVVDRLLRLARRIA
jgi:MGT family glycosyltransferase